MEKNLGEGIGCPCQAGEFSKESRRGNPFWSRPECHTVRKTPLFDLIGKERLACSEYDE